jgi:hypothetical protein
MVKSLKGGSKKSSFNFKKVQNESSFLIFKNCELGPNVVSPIIILFYSLVIVLTKQTRKEMGQKWKDKIGGL